MHNNIMAAGSRDRPSMLATGRYPQWRSRFLRYIDTRPNGDSLRKCILSGPYKPTTVLVQAVAATDDSPAIPEHTTTAQEMWEAIERLQQGESLNIQDVKTNLFGEFASEEDSDPEQAQRDKDMQKNLALIAKYFKKIYKPTNNNLRTFSNSRNKNVDTTLRYKNDNQPGQFGNQRKVNVAGARENVGSPVVQQSGIQCFNYKEFGHFAKECRKPKRVKDSAYHKEKILLCKQAEQYDWLADTYEEIDKQELDAHYSYMAKIHDVPTADTCTDSEPLEQVQNVAGYNVFANNLQHSEQSNSISNTCSVETDDSNVIPDSPDMCNDDIQNDQNDVESDDERVALANLKLDTEFEKYKAFNDRTNDYDKLECKLNETLGQLAQNDIEIKEGLKTKAYEISVVKEKYDELIKQSLLTKSHYQGLVKQKTKQEMHADLKYVESLEKEIDELEYDKAEFSNMYDMVLQESMSNDVMCSYLLLLSDVDALAELQCLYLHKVKECDCLAQKLLKQTESVSKEVHNELLQHFAKVEKHYISLEIALQKYLKAQLQDKNIAISELKKLIEKGKGKSVETKFDKPSVVRQPNAQHIPKPSVLVCANYRYGDLVQRNITINRVYYVECLNHNLFSVGQFCDADLEVAFRKSICFVRDLQGNNLLTGKCGYDLYTISLQESTSSTPLCLMAKASPTQAWLWHRRLSHLNFDYINRLSRKDVMIGLPKLKYVKDQLCSSCEVSKAKRSSFKSKAIPSSKGRLNLLHMDLCSPMRVASINGKKYILNDVVEQQNRTLVEAARTMLSASKLPLFFWAEAIETACYTQNRSIIISTHDKMASDYDNSDPVPQLHNVSSSTDAHVPLQQELDLLFGLLYKEFFNAGSNPQDKQPTTNIQPTSAPSTPIYVHVEENNDNQAKEEYLPDDEFTNPFCASAQEVAESSSHNIGNSNVPTFNQPQVSKYRWTKDHPLEQVHGNPSRPVQTRRQLATDPEMCMFALTVSTAEPKNFKEAMADSAWIEAMQEELH
nr:retrovirus-related Pol polyprotein from transposon TNT 1-94 [Tanacetum cinerariifolium]